MARKRTLTVKRKNAVCCHVTEKLVLLDEHFDTKTEDTDRRNEFSVTGRPLNIEHQPEAPIL